jgi:hypothetical protein
MELVPDWLPLHKVEPKHGQWIVCRNNSAKAWIEQWDSTQEKPFDYMTHWVAVIPTALPEDQPMPEKRTA